MAATTLIIPSRPIHKVKYELLKIWFFTASEQLSRNEAKQWTVRNWVERSMRRNPAPDFPTKKHKGWRDYTPEQYDILINSTVRDCDDQCELCCGRFNGWFINVTEEHSYWYGKLTKERLIAAFPQFAGRYAEIIRQIDQQRYEEIAKRWFKEKHPGIKLLHITVEEVDGKLDVEAQVGSDTYIEAFLERVEFKWQEIA